jgi:divalent metal cation (Fe/Co/Zn/Cd) transporter
MINARKHRARVFVSAGVGFLFGAAAFSWGWNRIAGDLGGFPEADFVHGIAALVATAAVAGVAAFAARLVSGGQKG